MTNENNSKQHVTTSPDYYECRPQENTRQQTTCIERTRGEYITAYAERSSIIPQSRGNSCTISSSTETNAVLAIFTCRRRSLHLSGHLYTMTKEMLTRQQVYLTQNTCVRIRES